MFAPVVRERISGYSGLISTLIEEFAGHRTVEIQQRINAIGIPKRLAAPLKVKSGTHALEITRSYLDDKERVFIVSRSIHPGGRFAYASRLRRQSASDSVFATAMKNTGTKN